MLPKTLTSCRSVYLNVLDSQNPPKNKILKPNQLKTPYSAENKGNFNRIWGLEGRLVQFQEERKGLDGLFQKVKSTLEPKKRTDEALEKIYSFSEKRTPIPDLFEENRWKGPEIRDFQMDLMGKDGYRKNSRLGGWREEEEEGKEEKEEGMIKEEDGRKGEGGRRKEEEMRDGERWKRRVRGKKRSGE